MGKATSRKRILAFSIALLMLVAIFPNAGAAGDAIDVVGGTLQKAVGAPRANAETFIEIPNEEDGFILVQNPNNGATLSYSPNSGVTLLSVTDGDYTYAFKDLNRNGELDLYEDWRLTAEERAADIAGKLSVEHIAGLMLYSPHQGGNAIGAELNDSQKRFLAEDNVRAVLNAGSGADSELQVKWSNALQAFVEGLDFGIPVNISTDPRNTSSSAEAYDGGTGKISKWPGNLGMGATFDPEIMLQFGEIASQEYRALGIGTALSPQIDLATEPRWNRINGTYSESPVLSTDMARAYVDGFQSTYVDGVDIGWGDHSVNAMIKHWPGDGAGEGGRESHANVGKYAVYPGNNMREHIMPFVEGAMNLNGKTGTATAIMPSYSIAIGADGNAIGEAVGSGYSYYKNVQLLRNTFGFEGVICSDWGITGMTCWGVETDTVVERHYLAIMNGLDMFGGNSDKQPVLDAYALGVEKVGEDVMNAQMEAVAYRVLLNEFRTNLFDNPYLDVSDSLAVLGNEEFMAAGYDAQLKSVVMLKNKGNVIKAADPEETEKPTVYIPMQFTPYKPAVLSPIDGSVLTPAQRASWRLGLDRATAEKYFVVVTDEASPDLDPNDPKETDYIRPTDFTGVDFALLTISSPTNRGSMFAGYGYIANARNLDPELGPIDNGYRPKSLQYREYTADPALVRAKPLGVDPAEEEAWIAAGGEPGTSRYYGGKSTTVSNESDLDLVLDTAEFSNGELPIIVMIRANNPMVFSEFEDKADAILMSFGASDQAVLDIVSGTCEPSGLLPLQMPANMETVETQLEDMAFDMDCHIDTEGNAYDFAFGLNWTGVISDTRTETYTKDRPVLPELPAPEIISYTTEANEADGFIVVYNPNDGAKLSYSPDSGVTLIEELEGMYLYAFKDLNRNGKLDAYEDWRLPAETRAADLAGVVSREQIAGLMLFSPHQGTNAINPELSDAQKRFLGEDNVRAVLNAGSGAANENQVRWSNALQAYVEGLGFGIPVNISSDPRNSASSGEMYDGGSGKISKWPGNLGLGATFDSDVTYLFGQIVSQEYRALGITTALSPQIDLSTEPRWSRVSGTYGESPELTSDIARAYTDGFQSTYVDGVDLGWGGGSVNAMIKHWPGDGPGEGGRESHSNNGKFAVYPGDNLLAHIQPFAAALNLNGKTETASAIMPSYSIGIDKDGNPLGGEFVGSGYSSYKLVELLRGEYGFEGVICSDWGITGTMTPWGVENKTVLERHILAIKNGLDMFGGNSAKQPVLDAFDAIEEEMGTDALNEYIEAIAYRVLLNEFRTNLFEDPYLNVADSLALIGNEEFMQAGYDAQLKSVVMLKNEGNVIKAAEASDTKPTVYIPMQFTPYQPAIISPIDGSVLTPAIQASWKLGLNKESAEQYFNVITDTPSPDMDPADPKETDYIRPSSFEGVDFAILTVASPANRGGGGFGGAGGYNANAINLDPELGPLNNGYYPKTLQYRPYTANPLYVREKPLGVDPNEEETWIAAGGEPGMSRYYGGKTAYSSNESDLDLILNTSAIIDGSIPVIVAIRASSPMVFNEFEDKVDAIVLGFGASDQALLEVLAGRYEPSGLLPFQMPANMDIVEWQYEDSSYDMVCHEDTAGNLYHFGFGLNWAGVINDERTEKYGVEYAPRELPVGEVSLAVSPANLVATLSAYLRLEVTGCEEATYAYIMVGNDKMFTTQVTGGNARMYIDVAPAAGTYYVMLEDQAGNILASDLVEVVEYNTDIWTAQLITDADGDVNMHFVEAVAPAKKGGYVPKINTTTVTCAQAGTNAIKFNGVKTDELQNGDVVSVKGVVYPRLFPSYSFTFKITYGN